MQLDLRKKLDRDHVKERAAERCFVHVNRDGYRKMSAMIRDGNAVYLQPYSYNTAMYGVKFAGIYVIVLYRPDIRSITTVMPNKYYEMHKDKLRGK